MPVAELKARLTGDSSSFTKSTDRAVTGVNKLKASVKSIGPQLAAAFSVAAIVSLARSSLEAAEKIEKLSIQFGLSTDQIQRLQFAADQTKTNLSDLNGAFIRLIASGRDALDGNKRYEESLERLGLNAEKIKSLNVEEQFLVIADEVRNAADQGQAFADVVRVMGKRGAEIVPILKLGREEIQNLFDQAPLIENDTIRQLNIIKDEMAALKATFAPIIADALKRVIFVVNGIVAAFKILGLQVDLFLDKINGVDKAISDLNKEKKLEEIKQLLTPAKGNDLDLEKKAKIQRGLVDELAREAAQRDELQKIIERNAKLAEDFSDKQLTTAELLLKVQQKIANLASEAFITTDAKRRAELEGQILQLKISQLSVEKQLKVEAERTKRDDGGDRDLLSALSQTSEDPGRLVSSALRSVGGVGSGSRSVFAGGRGFKTMEDRLQEAVRIAEADRVTQTAILEQLKSIAGTGGTGGTFQ